MSSSRYRDTEIIDHKLQYWIPPSVNFDRNRTYSIPVDEVGRPDKISQTVYGSDSYDWLILYYNKVLNPFTDLNIGRVLKIPFLEDVRWLS